MDHRGTEMLVPDRSLVPSQQPFPVDAHPMVLDLSRIPAVVLIVEQRPVVTLRGEKHVGHGENVLGDPRVALAWCVNELRALGITLREGEVITTGTCCTPLPIQAGDVFAADFGVLGKVSVGFS